MTLTELAQALGYVIRAGVNVRPQPCRLNAKRMHRVHGLSNLPVPLTILCGYGVL